MFKNPMVQPKFDPSNPSQFDYVALARALQQKGQLGQMLMQTPSDFGNVPVSRGTSIASGLAKALGGYLQGRAMRGERELDTAAKEQAAWGQQRLAQMQSPDEMVRAANTFFPTPENVFTYRNPGDVGPPMGDTAPEATGPQFNIDQDAVDSAQQNRSNFIRDALQRQQAERQEVMAQLENNPRAQSFLKRMAAQQAAQGDREEFMFREQYKAGMKQPVAATVASTKVVGDKLVNVMTDGTTRIATDADGNPLVVPAQEKEDRRQIIQTDRGFARVNPDGTAEPILFAGGRVAMPVRATRPAVIRVDSGSRSSGTPNEAPKINALVTDRSGNIRIAPDAQKQLAASRLAAEKAANALPIIDKVQRILETGNVPESRLGALGASAGGLLPSGMQPDFARNAQNLEDAASALIGLLDDPRLKGNPVVSEAQAVMRIINNPTIPLADKIERVQTLTARFQAELADHNDAVAQYDDASRQRLSALGLDAVDPGRADPARGVRQGALPATNSRGWRLMTDANGNRAYVSPDGKQFEEVK